MDAAIPLTSLSHGAGCGCKLAAADVLPIVRALPASVAPELLVARMAAPMRAARDREDRSAHSPDVVGAPAGRPLPGHLGHRHYRGSSVTSTVSPGSIRASCRIPRRSGR